MGHLLRYHAERPVVVDNFGDDLGGEHFADSMRLFSTTDESAALEILDRYRAPYLVTGDPPRVPGGRERIVTRLHRFDGNGGRTVEGGKLPALQHFRLIHESALDRVSINRKPPTGSIQRHPLSKRAGFMVWERVAGAELVGQATPGSEVTATLTLKTNRGRRFELRIRGTTDHRGRYRLRVPYDTGREGEVVATEPCRVEVDGLAWGVEIDAVSVREGRAIEVTGD